MLDVIKESEDFDHPLPTHNVDHMVSKSWLEKYWGKDAVVNVVFSEKRINQRVGSLIETRLPSPSFGTTSVSLNAISLAKLFYDNDQDSSDINEILQEAFSRFLVSPEIDQMLNDIGRELLPGFCRQQK
ncbi:hypothetical protein E1297_33945 [Roseibium sp. RKSG952]|nr:hypothetical protein [Roseibium sp. RKSG952]